MLSIQELHEKCLYPVVRVSIPGEVGGSGTIIYSQPDPDKPDEYQTFILTCSHVIDRAIKTKKDWDGLLKKKVEKEFLEQITVEIFDYVHLSEVNSSNSHKADIIAYDKYHDIAILKLVSPKSVPYVAKIIPKAEIEKVKCFTPTWTCGCSLLHDPFGNPGNVTYLKEMIEQRLYWMGNGHSIFGNSGGAVFLAETGEQIGITARITGIQLGFGFDIMTWMGFFVAPQRLYEFFDEQELKFLYDSTDTFKKAMVRRQKKEKQAKMLRMVKPDEPSIEELEEEEEPEK